MESEFSDPELAGLGETENGENAPVYCVCRKPDINCFMIGCDHCNEWFHGHCINITEKMAKAIREWYCMQCRDKNPTLEIKYRHKKSKERERETDREESEENYKSDRRKNSSSSSSKKMLRVRDDESSGFRDTPEPTSLAGSLSDDDLALDPELYQELCAGGAFDDHNLPWLSDTDDTPFLDSVLRKRAVKVKHVKRREKKSEKKKDEKGKRHKQKQRHKDKAKHTDRTESRDFSSLRQCLGPSCVQPARATSKYCSDDCGMKLAANRIYEILPQRIQQWQQSPCIAEEQGKKLLERIRREQQQARTKLQEMERKFHELEAVISKAKQQHIREDEETNDGDSDDTDLQIFCVSCGHPINPKVALRHMERCYAKYESQTSFGSMYPTRIEGATRLFCDVYNPQSKTYCKRLQVLCPEHSRDPKVPADEVCGCPMVKDVFELTGEFCRIPKRKCNRHYCWEKLRRAEVDLERVRVWYKLDELFEQERNVRMAMTNRAGLLALMLHQTIQHDPVTTDLRTNMER
ncbi:CXXC-type zinc finger protein 1 isoform X3 [Spea bombifrons]|uniref:CXXC-type zinc finger protein 1 isoform X3 n=1 Tax=Spea bombifrons TaxID=233779 RepID=UPI00234B3E41|nr:CXXC-type zinc finger protein 1 isoform X3 [Spea bombifrons]